MITPVILLITNDVPKDMGRSPRALIASMLVVLMLLSGCTSPDVDQPVLIGEELEGVENPCSQPTEPLAQSNTILNVGGVDRMFRLSIPSSDAGTELPILLAFHGEDMAEDEFPQQASFDALGEEHGFIMAYAVAEQGRTAAEGDWFLNTAKNISRRHRLRLCHRGCAVQHLLCGPNQTVCNRVRSWIDAHV